MTVVTRFAPSPTGLLHIGGARTALFNWLYARGRGGRFLLRVEDTDRARSSPEATRAILDGLSWLQLDWDDEPMFQSNRSDRHREVADTLLRSGAAYRCYCTPDELAAMRARAAAEKREQWYDGRWRDRDPSDAPAGVRPTIRMRTPARGETAIADAVQGRVTVRNREIDDFVILRADGTPTYMLSVVVDDHDMGITHVIRGDDHFTNAFRQCQIHDLLGWRRPAFAHIPLIHGSDGRKLSKRDGALGIEHYRQAGYLPAAVRNYLLRLGWAHGDDEVIRTADAIRWFDLDGIGLSPSRFDLGKLDHLNAVYLRETGDPELASAVAARLAAEGVPCAPGALERLTRGMAELKKRARTLGELAAAGRFYAAPRPLDPDPKARRHLDAPARGLLRDLANVLADTEDWSSAALETRVRDYAARTGRKLGAVAQPLRAALAGSTISPPIFSVMQTLGRTETLGRMADVVESGPAAPAQMQRPPSTSSITPVRN